MSKPIGSIIAFGGNYAPKGWYFCQGQVLSINSETEALFKVISTKFGGDGRTTFQLPDLRGRIPVGVGQGTGYGLGNKGGQEKVTLTTQQIASHNHTTENEPWPAQAVQNVLNDTNEASVPPMQNFSGFVSAVANFQSGLTTQRVKTFGPATNTVKGQALSSNVGLKLSQSGGSTSHDNIQPSLVMNFIINCSDYS